MFGYVGKGFCGGTERAFGWIEDVGGRSGELGEVRDAKGLGGGGWAVTNRQL